VSHLILDTDGASDDLVALLMASRAAEDPRLSLITTVAGAVDIEQATVNIESILALAGADIPVVIGAASPLTRPLENEAAIRAHGPSGVAGAELPRGPQRRTSGPAAKAIIEAVRSHPGEVTLILIGPVTNLALALRLDPGIAPLFERVVISSGTVSRPGNVVPAADFNFWIDPEAAHIVLESGAPITLVPWDRYQESAVLTPDELASARANATDAARYLLAANEGIEAITARITPFDSGLVIGDTIAVAIVQHPELVTEQRAFHTAVETDSPLTRGVTVVDVYGVTDNQPNTEVVLGIDRPAFMRILLDALR
jgi:purine nucleosidase